jgi:putative transposase
MIAFIDDHRQAYGVEPICRVLPIAPSTYHAHAGKRADPSRLPERVRRDADLKVEIRRVFEENFRVYGVRKVWRQLRREGFSVARCTVARLMRNMGLRGAIRGKPLRTTVSHKAVPCPLDHVNRQFQAPAPDRLWLADFTYVSTWAGFIYVAFVIDAYARRIVGWRASRTAHADFVLDALEHRRSMTEGLPAAAASFIIAIAAPNMFRSSTPSVSPQPGSSLPSAASATLTTTPSPKRSMASTKPRSSIDADRGVTSRPSSSQPSSGWTGSTIVGFWSPSASSRRPKPRNATSPC